jgi:hypothetical protein
VRGEGGGNTAGRWRNVYFKHLPLRVLAKLPGYVKWEVDNGKEGREAIKAVQRLHKLFRYVDTNPVQVRMPRVGDSGRLMRFCRLTCMYDRPKSSGLLCKSYCANRNVKGEGEAMYDVPRSTPDPRRAREQPGFLIRFSMPGLCLDRVSSFEYIIQ